jgi:phage-related protein
MWPIIEEGIAFVVQIIMDIFFNLSRPFANTASVPNSKSGFTKEATTLRKLARV